MIEYRDKLALEWRLNLVVGQNREALKEKQTFPDDCVDRITCCRNLKTMALRHTLSGEWPRLRMDHTLGKLVEDEDLSLIHISEPTRLGMISYAVFCLKKK